MNKITVAKVDASSNATNFRYFAKQVDALFTNHEQAALVIDLITQYQHLVKDIQRHRGISMGLLAGESEYLNEFSALQQKIERRFAVIDHLSVRSGKTTFAKERENLRYEWKTIKQDWQEDKISDNFELHSHFIAQVFHCVGTLSKASELNALAALGGEDHAAGSDEYAPPRHAQKAELLSFSCALLPNMVENMARIRGLASFSAAMGSVASEHGRKLGYYLQSVREQNGKVRHCAQRLHTVLDGELNAKQVVDELETKFLHFLGLVSNDVLAGQRLSFSASSLFDLATDLIDRYWQIVDDGLDLFRAWHRQDLENWIGRTE